MNAYIIDNISIIYMSVNAIITDKNRHVSFIVVIGQVVISCVLEKFFIYGKICYLSHIYYDPYLRDGQALTLVQR